MRSSPWYIVFLLAFIGVSTGYVFVNSEVRTVHVTGKHLEDGRGRYGTTTTRYVIETDQGAFPILTFPIIGYVFSAGDAYADVMPGQRIAVRLGQWPPELLGSNGRPHIMSIF